MTAFQGWTPGPWRYDRRNASPTTGEHMIAGGKPGYLAEVRDCGTGDVQANAHLIAAAPDLYDAVVGLLSLLDAGSLYEPQAYAARAALARAKGATT